MTLSLGVLTSHPIQYQAPLFREMAKRVDLHVFFAHRQTPQGQAAAGFGSEFEWDIDLLGGYSHEFLVNRATRPDVSRFFGCDTPEIRKRIAHNKFDAFLVMGWGLRCYWQAVAACRSSGVPVMVRGDSQLATSRSPIKRAIKALVYPSVLARFDACVYVGQRNRQYLEHYGVDDARLFYSPHCIDNDWFRSQAAISNSLEVRRSLGIGPDENMLLFVGKLIPIKRPAVLLEACAQLGNPAKKICCVFAGAGELESTLKEIAERHNVHASFPGFVNQTALPAFYHASDLVVLPSESETWGLVANESLACGTPVLVSDACGCAPDLVEGTGAGASFPAGDAAALAKAISSLLEQRPEPSEISRVADSHSLECSADGIIAATQHLARTRDIRVR